MKSKLKLHPMVQFNKDKLGRLYYGFTVDGEAIYLTSPIFREVVDPDEILILSLEEAIKQSEKEIDMFLEENKDKDIKSIKTFSKDYKNLVVPLEEYLKGQNESN